MTKDSIIKAREDLSGNPIRIICDNMIIVWDKADSNSVVVWDDDNDRLIAFMVNGNINDITLQQQFPFIVTYTDYELIQYMEMYSAPQDAVKWASQYKSQLGDEYDKVMDIIKKTRMYQGHGYSGGSIVSADRQNR